MWWMIAGAALGAASGVIGTIQKSEQEKTALRHQKEMAWQQYLYAKEHGDRQYDIQKREAYYQLGEQDRALREDMGLFNDRYNTGLLAQAFGERDARMQAAQQEGAHLAAEGAGGTRGNAANEMIRAYARQGIEENIDIQKKQNAYSLAESVDGANRTVRAITHERDSWNPGGHRYRSKAAQDSYNLNQANLGQFDMDTRIGWATPTALDYITAAFGGGQQGYSLGQGIYDFSKQYNANKKPWESIGGNA